MGDTNAALLQAILKRNAAASAAQPQNPWNFPQGPAPAVAPVQEETPAPPPVVGGAMSPEDQIAELIRQRQALANPSNPYQADAMAANPLVQKLAGLLGR